LAKGIFNIIHKHTITKQQLAANKQLVEQNFNAAKIATETLEAYKSLCS
jgi:hypothetical protein